MIFIASIVLCGLGLLLLISQKPTNWVAIACLAVAVAHEIAILSMYEDIKFLKKLHAEDFKKRDNSDDIYKGN